MDFLRGATQTGGSSVTYTSAGQKGGSTTYVGPDHTRLEPRSITVTTATQKGKVGNPDVARTGVTINFSDVVSAVEGSCCDTKYKWAIADLGLRYSMNETDGTLVDAVIAELRGYVYSTEFEDAVKLGIHRP